MNTPSHLIVGVAAFGKPEQRWTTLAALLGSLAPDLSLYLLAGVSLLVLQIPPQIVFDELYFSDTWQMIFSIDNSFVLWGGGFIAGLWWRNPVVIAFAGAALLHIGSDFLLHNDDARAHFWPLTDWRFNSPVSYWDSDHGARIAAPALAAIALACGVLLWRRYVSWGWRILWLALVGMELFTLRSWLLFF